MPELESAHPTEAEPRAVAAPDAAAASSLAGQNPQPTLRHMLGRIDRTLRSRLNVRLERLGLTAPEYTMLFVLRRLPGLSNADLARTVGLAPQSSISRLQSLVERRLVERRKSDTHKRVLHNFLTPAGIALIEQCEAEAAEIEATMLRHFGGYEREQVERLLRRCAENLDINL